MNIKRCFFLCYLLLFSCSADASTSVTFPDSWDVGQAFAVALSSHTSYEEPTVNWLGVTVSLDVEQGREGYVSYGLLGSFVRDVKPGVYPLNFEFTQDNERFLVKCEVTLREKKYPEEHLTVDDKMVTPPKKESGRIQKEAALAKAALNTKSVKRLWTTPPRRPVQGIFTSAYGLRRVYNGVPRGYHAGTDFRAPTGTPISAPFAGEVVLTGKHYYSGGSVYIDSGNGVISAFFHMSRVDVKKGDKIAQGQVVGLSGATGRVTGPHLHYVLSLSGQQVDAAPLFETSITALLNAMQSEIVRQ
ncbi:peptidase M23 [Synergistales bacterium]|nr:peptidase M23 [Synergistales bacterium]